MMPTEATPRGDCFPDCPPELEDWKPDPDTVPRPGKLIDRRFNKPKVAIEKEAAFMRELEVFESRANSQRKPALDSSSNNQPKTALGFNGNNQPKTALGFNGNNQPKTALGFNGNNQPKPALGFNGNNQPKPALGFNGNNQPKPAPGFNGNNQPKPAPGFNGNNQPKPALGFNGNNQPKPAPGFNGNNQPNPASEFRTHATARPAVKGWPAQQSPSSSAPKATFSGAANVSLKDKATAAGPTAVPVRATTTGVEAAKMLPGNPTLLPALYAHIKADMKALPVTDAANLNVSNKDSLPSWAGPLEKMLSGGPKSESNGKSGSIPPHLRRPGMISAHELDGRFEAACETSRRLSSTDIGTLVPQAPHVQPQFNLAAQTWEAKYARAVDIAVIKFMEAELDTGHRATKSELTRMEDQEFKRYMDRVKAEHKMWWMVENKRSDD